MRNLVLFIFLASVPLQVLAHDDQKDYSEAFKLIEVWLDAQRDYDNLPGITAAIVDGQELVWSGAFGKANIEENIDAQTSTIGSICSISKLFTSVAVMSLYDQGKLRLDDRIDEVLPWYDLEQKFPESGPITIRTLLSHSSGLPRENYFSHWNAPDNPFPTREQIRERLSEQSTMYPASSYLQYSNLALVLLGEVIEKLSGESYSAYVNRTILEPLDLTNTRTYMPETLHGNELAVGYSVLTRGGERKEIELFDAEGVEASAGFSSNVEDLSRFASWQFRLRDATEPEILNPATLKYMQNVHWTNPDFKSTRGLGFGVYQGQDGNRWAGHGGYCPGYQSSLQLNLDRNLAYSAMVNANGVDMSKYVNGMHGILTRLSANGQSEKSEPLVDLKEYTGYYEWKGSRTMQEHHISTWEGQLVMLALPTDSPAEDMAMFKPVEGDTFRRVRPDGELGESLVFDRDEDGKIHQLKRFDNWTLVRVDR